MTATPIATFADPTYIAGAPGSPDLLFVTERSGRVEVMQDEVPAAEPFLDISDLVLGKPDPTADAEQGLLSIAFPADYATSGLFYVYYVNNDWDVEIDEFARSPGTDLTADPASRRPVIVIPHRNASNHNGGQLQFGPNGRILYFATGDGGAGQKANAPNLDSLLGKVLRIKPRPHSGQPYGVPHTNPFVGVPGRDEIFAYGMRNPWRFTFDGGRIAIGDVGLATEEEIDLLRIRDARGANFGWPEYEGDLLNDPSLPGADLPTFPIHTYSHAGGGCVVVGGYVVRDPNLTDLYGRYLYGDFCTGELRSFRPALGSGPPGTALDDAPVVGISAPTINTFGEAADGRIYYAKLDGGVYRLDQGGP